MIREIEQPGLSVSATRNSELRMQTAGMVQNVVDRLHRNLPDLSPTHLNILGALGVGIGSILSTQRNGKNLLHDKVLSTTSLSLIGASESLDALDGTLARTIARESPGRINFRRGQLYDTLSDRSQELFMALAHAVYAQKRGDQSGTIMALLNAATNTFPSTARAYAESHGKAVPETERGILGIAGTRAGRAILGVAATIFPEIHGIPNQVILDTLVTSINIANAFDRLRSAKRQTHPPLSQTTRDEATERFKTLALFAGLSLGATLLTYLKLRKKDVISHSKREIIFQEPAPEKNWYMRILSAVENYCQVHNLYHRFVGGTITDFIGPQTQFEIDIDHQTVTLHNSIGPDLQRSDGTVKDLDLVVFSPDREEFEQAKRTFKEWEDEARKANIPIPHISLEAARYPDWPKRNKLKQFVSAFEVDEKRQLYLTFDNISHQIPWETVTPAWKIKLDSNTTLTMLHPFAHALCYMLRVPSGVKPKDKKRQTSADGSKYNKISLMMKLARQVMDAGRERHIDYYAMYKNWIAYIENLKNHPDPITKTKAIITDLYWRTIGTDVSHGYGIYSRLANLSNRFSG